jgi:hypothetical protein
MLAVTIALLAGGSAVALLSIRNGAGLVQAADSKRASQAGVLVEVVASQSNGSGTFVWLFNYGWVGAPISGVYMDGRGVGWSSNCSTADPGRLCVLVLPPGSTGEMDVVMDGVSVAARV